MSRRKSDKQWEDFAQISPYYAVLSHEKFKAQYLNDDDVKDFFQSGELHIEKMLEWVITHLDPEFKPERCLDFGCGVGRLLIPLAKRFSSVVGVDVSRTMLEEARTNCRQYGLENVELAGSDDGLSQVAGKFDFIHSYITFQHITRQRGESLLMRLIELMNTNGIAAVHITYGGDRTMIQRVKYWIHRFIPPAHALANLIKGRKLSEPPVMINRYDLNRVFRLIQEGGCEHSYVRFSDHAGLLGVFLVFQKKAVGIVL